MGGKKAGEEAFEADQVFVAFGQGTDGNEYLAEVSQWWARG